MNFPNGITGWWDNYLTQEQRDRVLLAVKQKGDQVTQNAVYTLVLNIIEHFLGRWSDNSEIIRTLLQNLRCKTLTSLQDTTTRMFSYVESWNYQSGRKAIRGDNHSINYDDYTYGKLISACVQEELFLCNEIKLNQH
ncbi:hypothetical protein H5410_065038 [Solanum commersonii]|uniref:Uncharacterized protein n=1 Tax=Solanum commersonii TaxID=4109 RepID=A0A9J5VXM8_SOLCO|nr:hypothetical protein H5410_065038 [Solanum commersonii]